MSDDLDDDRNDRIRAGRESPLRPRRPDDPSRPQPSRRRDEIDDRAPRGTGGGSGAGKVVLIIVGVVALLGCCLIGGVGAIIGLAVPSIRQSAEKQTTSNNYKQIGIAMHNYHDAYGRFPPLSMKTRNGKPGLSWRVALLPFLEQESLYKQFKIDESWDHPDNLRLAERMPDVYAPKKGAGGKMTHVRVFVGPGAIFEQNRDSRRIAEITDGTSNTVLVVEATQPVVWIQPDELPFDPKGPLPSLGLPDHDYFITLFADAAVRPIRKTITPEKLKAGITANGNEMVDFVNER